MTAAAWTLTNTGLDYLTRGEWLDADSFKIALFTSSSNIAAASTTYAALTGEVSNANGYLTGGTAVTVARTGTNPLTIDSSDASWNATGAGITARYAVLYEVSGRVMGYSLLDTTPADVSVTAGNVFQVQIHPSGVYTLSF